MKPRLKEKASPQHVSSEFSHAQTPFWNHTYCYTTIYNNIIYICYLVLYIHMHTRHTHMNLIHRIFFIASNTCLVLYIIEHTYMHACMHTCIHASMHPCIHASMHPCIHASMHTCIHASMHPCIHASMHPCIHPSIHTYIYIHIFKGLRLTARRRPSNLGTMLALCWAYVGLCWDYVGPC